MLSGDTRFSENLIRFAKGTDVLIHEVLDPEAYNQLKDSAFTNEQRQKVIAHHITPQEAGMVFTRVKPKLAVYSHIVPPAVPGRDPSHSQNLLRSSRSGRRTDEHRDRRENRGAPAWKLGPTAHVASLTKSRRFK